MLGGFDQGLSALTRAHGFSSPHRQGIKTKVKALHVKLFCSTPSLSMNAKHKYVLNNRCFRAFQLASTICSASRKAASQPSPAKAFDNFQTGCLDKANIKKSDECTWVHFLNYDLTRRKIKQVDRQRNFCDLTVPALVCDNPHTRGLQSKR